VIENESFLSFLSGYVIRKILENVSNWKCNLDRLIFCLLIFEDQLYALLYLLECHRLAMLECLRLAHTWFIVLEV